MEKTLFDGKRLQKLRLAKGMTQEEAAHLAGTCIAQVSRLERGETKSPRTETLKRFADIFGCREEDFFSKVKVDSVGEPPRQLQVVDADPLYPDENKALASVYSGITPDKCREGRILEAIGKDIEEFSKKHGSVQVVIIGNQTIWFRFLASPVVAQRLVLQVNDEKFLSVGLLRGQMTCLGAGRDDWSCDHHVGPTIQEIVANRLSWEKEDVTPKDSLFYLGASEEEAEEIIVACARARGVSTIDIFETFEQFLMSKYALPYIDTWLMAPLCDLCEHIHRRELDK